MLAAVLLGAAPIAAAGTVPSTPDRATWVTDGTVRAIATAADGTTYIGGDFTYVGPNTGCGAILDAGGHVAGAPLGVDAGVFASTPDGSGGLYIGGTFTNVGGTRRSGLAHLLPDGTLDAAWQPDMDGGVFALTVSRDGRTVYVGGYFRNIGGRERNNIAALHATTGAATDWDPSANGGVTALALSDDESTVYAGGSFRMVGGGIRRRIAALDAATGEATDWNPRVNSSLTFGSIYALAVARDTVYAGGNFVTIGGQQRSNIAALDAETGAATSWDPDSDDVVVALAVHRGTVYAAGRFDSIGGRERSGIAALDAGTGAATEWDPDASDWLFTLSLSADGSTVYAGGEFKRIGGRERSGIAALDATSGVATDWNPRAGIGFGGRPPIVRCISVYGDSVFAGGEFGSVGGRRRDHIAALDATTGAATSWDPDADGEVLTLTLSADGSTVYAGGWFLSIGGRERSRIAALDAATGAATSWDPDADGGVVTLVPSADGSAVYAGGEFERIGSRERSSIAALDTATGAATSWDPDADGEVLTLELSADGSKVYAGGRFLHIGARDRSRIAALDASSGAATGWDPNATDAVFALARSADGSTVYAGGWFQSMGGRERSGIAAIDAATGAATDWDPSAVQWVYALAVCGDTVYAGGDFESIGGRDRNGLAALDAVTGAATDWDPDPDTGEPIVKDVFAVTVSGDGRTLHAGGGFWTMHGLLVPNLAAFRGTGTYTVAPSVTGGHGTITPATAQEHEAGATPTFTFTPQFGYSVKQVLVDGSPVSMTGHDSYTFAPLEADHTISVEFGQAYAITALATTSGGTVSPLGTTWVPFFGALTVSVTPAAHYHTDRVTIDGAAVGVQPSYTFVNVSARHRLEASFALDRYAVTPSVVRGADSRPHGSISPATTGTYAWGATPTYRFTPESGYAVFEVRVDGVQVLPTPRTSYTFAPLAGAHTISVRFVKNYVPAVQ